MEVGGKKTEDRERGKEWLGGVFSLPQATNILITNFLTGKGVSMAMPGI
jgi:hypothetical protein